MSEQKFKPERPREEISFEQAFQQLQEILSIIEGAGLTVPEYCHSYEKIQEEWKSGRAFPIAREGVDGIRMVRMHNGNFRVFFSNGFEEPNDPKRIEITEKLRFQGFDVV